MTGIRLAPEGEAAFPYDLAKRYLGCLPGMAFEPLDLVPTIELGRRLGWPMEAIDAQWARMQRGKCLSFRQKAKPELVGNLVEDGILFLFYSAEHEELARPAIESIARRLGLAMLEE
jgi:hypothetical protein